MWVERPKTETGRSMWSIMRTGDLLLRKVDLVRDLLPVAPLLPHPTCKPYRRENMLRSEQKRAAVFWKGCENEFGAADILSDRIYDAYLRGMDFYRLCELFTMEESEIWKIIRSKEKEIRRQTNSAMLRYSRIMAQMYNTQSNLRAKKIANEKQKAEVLARRRVTEVQNRYAELKHRL